MLALAECTIALSINPQHEKTLARKALADQLGAGEPLSLSAALGLTEGVTAPRRVLARVSDEDAVEVARTQVTAQTKRSEAAKQRAVDTAAGQCRKHGEWQERSASGVQQQALPMLGVGLQVLRAVAADSRVTPDVTITEEVCFQIIMQDTCPSDWGLTSSKTPEGWTTHVYRNLKTDEVLDRAHESFKPPGGTRSYAQLTREKGGELGLTVDQPNRFVSHAWQLPFSATVSALEEGMLDKGSSVCIIGLQSSLQFEGMVGQVLETEVEGNRDMRLVELTADHWSTPKKLKVAKKNLRGVHVDQSGNASCASDVRFWFDIFSINEHDPPRLSTSAEGFSTIFMNAIGSIGHVLFVCDMVSTEGWNMKDFQPFAMTRMWCLWELLCTNKTGSKIQMCLSEKARMKMLTFISENSNIQGAVQGFVSPNAYQRAFNLSSIDCSKATAGSQSDMAMIGGSIEKNEDGTPGVGFAQLDFMCVEQLRILLSDLLQLAADRLRHTNHTNFDPGVAFQLKVLLLHMDRFYNSWGQHDVAEACAAESTMLEKQLGQAQAMNPIDAALEADTVLLSKEATAVALKNQGDFDQADKIMSKVIAERMRLKELEGTILAMGNIEGINGFSHEPSRITAEGAIARQNHSLATSLMAQAGVTGARLQQMQKSQGDLMSWPEEFKDWGLTLAKEAATQLYNACCLFEEYSVEGEENGLGLAMSKANLAAIMSTQLGDWDACEMLEREVLALRRRTLGDRAADTIQVMANLAMTLLSKGSRQEAEALMCESSTSAVSMFGEQHPLSADLLQKLQLVTLLRKNPSLNAAKVRMIRENQFESEARHLTAFSLGFRLQTSGGLRMCTPVRIGGLQTESVQHLNDKVGWIVSWNDQKCRYVVELDNQVLTSSGESRVLLKPCNIVCNDDGAQTICGLIRGADPEDAH